MVRWRPRIEGTCGSTHVAYAAACSRIAGSYTWWLARPDRPHVKQVERIVNSVWDSAIPPPITTDAT
jgi:hypothetical protein